MMPAKSKEQQQLMGQVRAHQKGELKNPSKKVRDMARQMNPADVSDFARTKHKDIEKSAARMVIEHVVFTKRAAKVYVGRDSKLSKGQINNIIGGFESRGGEALDKMRVLSSKRQFFRNLARQYVPTSTRQIPRRIGKLATTAATAAMAPVLPGLAAGQILSTLEAAAIGRDNMYVPATGTVNIENTKNKGLLAHEIGHWVDYEQNKSPYPRSGMLRGREDAPFRSLWAVQAAS